MSRPLAVCDLAGDEAVGEKDGLVLFLLAPCELMTTQGVVFWELAQGMDKEAIRRLKYPVTKDVENTSASVSLRCSHGTRTFCARLRQIKQGKADAMACVDRLAKIQKF